MTYGWEAYQADRVVMGLGVLVRLDEATVRRRRKALACDRVERDAAEIETIDAACLRLLALVASGEPEPMPPPPGRKASPVPDPATATAEPAPASPQPTVDLRAWRKRLADQQNRHKRRRGLYPHVRPTPKKPK